MLTQKVVELDDLSNWQLDMFFSIFNRDILRGIARDYNIPRGQSKDDLVHNLVLYRKKIKNRYALVSIV